MNLIVIALIPLQNHVMVAPLGDGAHAYIDHDAFAFHISTHIEFDLPALSREFFHRRLHRGDLRLERDFLIPELSELRALRGGRNPHGEQEGEAPPGNQREVLPRRPGRGPLKLVLDLGGARRHLLQVSDRGFRCLGDEESGLLERLGGAGARSRGGRFPHLLD